MPHLLFISSVKSPKTHPFLFILMAVLNFVHCNLQNKIVESVHDSNNSILKVTQVLVSVVFCFKIQGRLMEQCEFGDSRFSCLIQVLICFFL